MAIELGKSNEVIAEIKVFELKKKKEMKSFRRKKIIELSRELSEHGPFRFQGLEPTSYQTLLEDEAFLPEGMATPIDVLIGHMRLNGIKVTLGKNPESGNVFVLPANSTDIEMDSIFLYHLQERDDMDPSLRELIRRSKEQKVH